MAMWQGLTADPRGESRKARLISFGRLTPLGGDPAPVARLLSIRREEAVRAPSGGLGSVQCDIGAPQELIDACSIGWRNRYANAGADADGSIVDVVRVADQGDEPLGEFARLARLLDFGLDDREFIPA